MSNAELYAEAYPHPASAAAAAYGELPRRHYTNNKVWPADGAATTISTITTTTTTTSHEQVEQEQVAFFENVERKFYYNNNNIYKIFLFF